MKPIPFLSLVHVCVLLMALAFAGSSHASPVADALNSIESEWAKVYYQVPKKQQGPAYAKLLAKTDALVKQYPKEAGLIYWHAVVKACYADHQDPVSALGAIHEVRDLLQRSIALDPKSLGGSAYVVLGTLYHLTPSWPIAFGDDDEAEKMLQTALKISPDGIDSNYYYGQFLLDKGDKQQARQYFERASKAPIRPEQVFADTQLEQEAQLALKNVGGETMVGKKQRFSPMTAAAK